MAGLATRAGVWCGALLVVLALSAPARADPVVLTPDNMRRMTVLMLDQRRPDKALRLAEALLQRDPQDASALILKSRALRDLGQADAATATGRAAWRHADSPRLSFGAAMAVAQGLSTDGQKFRAQLWLRRAMAAAPDPRAKAMAERDFRYVRNRSRLSFRLDVSARPSSNVNGGTSERILDFYGIPLTISPDSRALSGGRVQAAVTLRYRLAESAKAKTDLRLGVIERRVWLSDKAKAEAPMADAADYAYSGVEIGIEQAWKLPVPGGEATLDLTLGHNRYGGADMSEYGRLDVGVGRSWKGGYQGKLSFSVEHQNRLDDSERSADVLSVTASGARRLANGDRLSVSVEARTTRSDADSIDHEAASMTVGWSRARPVFGTGLSLTLGVEARDYDRSALSTSGRQDLTVRGGISLSLERLDYMGFVPVLSLEAEHTSSNVVLNRSHAFGLGLGVVSKF